MKRQIGDFGECPRCGNPEAPCIRENLPPYQEMADFIVIDAYEIQCWKCGARTKTTSYVDREEYEKAQRKKNKKRTPRRRSDTRR